MAQAATLLASDGPDFFVRETEAEYREQAKTHLSSHALADFRKCPLLYWKRREGLIPDEDRPAYLVGRAAHSLILEGKAAFEREYVVGGPINPRTGQPYGQRTKAYADWAAAQDKAVLTNDQYVLVSQLAASVATHPVAREILSEGVAEGVARAEYCGVPCQIRIDWFHPERGIVDLKTCDDVTWFESDARRFGYAHQMAFYQAALECIAGERFGVHVIAVEKKEPFRCGVWLMDQQVLGLARGQNEAAIARLRQCEVMDTWPTGYEECRVFDYV